MINAKEELLEMLSNNNKKIEDIKVLSIVHKWYWDYGEDDDDKNYLQIENINIDVLDFEYGNGYGGQRLFGIILFNDNTWLERGEYDGSEWWEYKSPPTLETIKNNHERLIKESE